MISWKKRLKTLFKTSIAIVRRVMRALHLIDLKKMIDFIVPEFTKLFNSVAAEEKLPSAMGYEEIRQIELHDFFWLQ